MDSHSPSFTHVRNGNPGMVDIVGKDATCRTAMASVRVELGEQIMARFDADDLRGPKGPVIQTAIIAGTMAVKKTSDLIPFCHPLPVESCDFTIDPDRSGVTLSCEVSTSGKTGVEMEAMTGASIAALTIYDMCKAMNKGILIQDLHLVSKTGGKSGDFHAVPDKPATTVHGLVLAGGESRRMGTNKAAMLHPDGRPMAVRARDLLKQAGCQKVFVSIRQGQDVPEGVGADEILRDSDGGSFGPMTGILTAMRSHPGVDWLVVACDLPRLDLKTLEHLIASRTPEDEFLAYRSESDSLPEPLCAYYAAGALPEIARALTDDIRCPRKILMLHQCRLLEPVTPRALENANTPDDWEAATL